MAAASWTVAPALLALRDEIDDRWPERSRETDGFIGNAEHHMITDPKTGRRRKVKPGERPGGEHVPTDSAGKYRLDGVVRAGDYDCRLDDGTEFGDELVELLIADGKARERLAYVIFEGKIYSRNNSWKAGASSGHDHWVHVSLRNKVSSGGSTTASQVTSAAKDTHLWLPDQVEPEAPFRAGQKVVVTAAKLNGRAKPSMDADVKAIETRGYSFTVRDTAYAEGRHWVRGYALWWAAEHLKAK